MFHVKQTVDRFIKIKNNKIMRMRKNPNYYMFHVKQNRHII